MGHEYRLHTEPPLKNLDKACKALCHSTEWFPISTSFITVPGIGIQLGEEPVNTRWPHVVDLHDEGDGKIYVLCHCDSGWSFINELVRALKEQGYRINIDDNI